MLLQFDVIVGDGAAFDLRDGCAIDQVADRDQYTLVIDGVIGRQQKVSLWSPFAERVCSDAYRQDALAVGMAAEVDTALADPADRLRAAREGHDQVITVQPLDRYLAV